MVICLEYCCFNVLFSGYGRVLFILLFILSLTYNLINSAFIS